MRELELERERLAAGLPVELEEAEPRDPALPPDEPLPAPELAFLPAEDFARAADFLFPADDVLLDDDLPEDLDDEPVDPDDLFGDPAPLFAVDARGDDAVFAAPFERLDDFVLLDAGRPPARDDALFVALFVDDDFAADFVDDDVDADDARVFELLEPLGFDDELVRLVFAVDEVLVGMISLSVDLVLGNQLRN